MIERKAFLILVAVLISATLLCAQSIPRATLTGRVVDDSTSVPLQNVDVFIAQTTLGSGTDANGQFTIRNIPTGSYEIVASRVGYVLASVRLVLSDSGKREISIRLKPSAVQIEEVVVTALEDRQWREQLKKFTDLFLGKSANASRCVILNPEVLDFESGENGQFSAVARAPLEIENPSLGYHIRFILTQFRVGGLDVRYSVVQFGRLPEVLILEGFPSYRELKQSHLDDSLTWSKNRQKAFKGSLRHFLASMFRGDVIKNGYVLSLEPFVIAKEWDPMRRGVNVKDLLFNTGREHEKILKFNRYLEIEYTQADLEPEYDMLAKRGTDHQVSWLILNREAVTINSRGLINDWFPTVAYGYWAWQRIADALPQDYEPEQE